MATKKHVHVETFPMPAEHRVALLITPTRDGATLQVVQNGFPVDPAGDAFYAACVQGGRDTSESIRHVLTEDVGDEPRRVDCVNR